ncbi:hypothetical protein BDZ97DRAFT_1951060 [Flammula alnicola]|nr:hypothetical protein BDZ97DRAFT_1951060 [Flammula alnicola]
MQLLGVGGFVARSWFADAAAVHYIDRQKRNGRVTRPLEVALKSCTTGKRGGVSTEVPRQRFQPIIKDISHQEEVSSRCNEDSGRQNLLAQLILAPDKILDGVMHCILCAFLEIPIATGELELELELGVEAKVLPHRTVNMKTLSVIVIIVCKIQKV